MNVEEPKGEHTLEHSAYNVERSGTDIEAKVDEIIAGNREVKTQLSRRTLAFASVGILFFLILISLVVLLVRLNGVADRNKGTNMNTNQIVKILKDATGPDAQARQSEILKDAIDDIRHSMDCNTDYIKYNEVSDSCKEVIGRDEELRPPH